MNPKDSLDQINVCIPVVSAIVERVKDGKKEILVQTRWQPEIDPKYSGTIEIPAGWIDRYENVYEAVKREVFEETGLRVKKIIPEVKTKEYSPRDDSNFAFVPFCCQQQLKGGKPWVGFVFLCEAEDGELRHQEEETKDVRWIEVKELKKIFENTPKKIFTLQLGVLEYYFRYQNL